jgi:hypothetical protein
MKKEKTVCSVRRGCAGPLLRYLFQTVFPPRKSLILLIIANNCRKLLGEKKDFYAAIEIRSDIGARSQRAIAAKGMAAKIKITKRTHLSFFDLPMNTGDSHPRATAAPKNEPIFEPLIRRSVGEGWTFQFCLPPVQPGQTKSNHKVKRVSPTSRAACNHFTKNFHWLCALP